MSGSAIERAGDAVAGFTVSKGGLQFPIDGTLPVGLVRKLLALRLAELGEVRNGTRREYFPDGAVKAVGTMKDGDLHGAWTWYRQDGTVKRTGRFDRGAKVGTWQTFAADGTLVTSTT